MHHYLEDLLGDLRWAGRALRHAPGSTLAMITLLALGIGGVLALFGPLYSLVLTPLPFPESDRLVRISGTQLVDPYTNAILNQQSLDAVLAATAAHKTSRRTLATGETPKMVDVAVVSPRFFETLKVRPRLSSTYSEPFTTTAGVIVSDELWRTRLAGRRDLNECSVVLDGTRFDVIGVMPPDFDLPQGVQVWQPARPGALAAEPVVIGRLRGGVSVAQAVSSLRAMARSQNPALRDASLEPLQSAVLGDRRPLLWALSAVSVLFLLLACLGVANILFASGVRRCPEFVMRRVLGAGRVRLFTQLIAEAAPLAAAGGLLGWVLSRFATRWLHVLLPGPAKAAASLSAATLTLLLALTLAVTVVCGIAPAFYASGTDLNSSLKAGSIRLRIHTFGRHTFTAHEMFAAAQLVLAMVLLVSTGLLLHSMVMRINVPLGFDARNVAVVKIPRLSLATGAFEEYERKHGRLKVQSSSYMLAFKQAMEPTDEAAAARNSLFYAEATRRLAAIPGVASLAAISTPPFTRASLDLASRRGLFTPDRRDLIARDVLYREVSPGFFRCLGVPLLQGRGFSPEDAPPVDAWKYWAYGYKWWAKMPEPTEPVIVNATLARRLFRGQDPIGQTIYERNPMKVVGVVADIHESKTQLDVLPTVYKLLNTSDVAATLYTYTVRLKPGLSTGSFAAAVRSTLGPMLPGHPPLEVLPLEEPAANVRFALVLLGWFSALGSVVAGLGMYATCTLMVAARTRELAIRQALGARLDQIGGLVLWRSVRLALFALPAGALGALALALSLSHWLFQVSIVDAPSYLGSAAILVAISLAAGVWPAFRVTIGDPVKALRHDG